MYVWWGGGDTSSKYIVEMQPRWFTDLIIMNKLELWTNPDDGGGVAFTQKYVGHWSSWKIGWQRTGLLMAANRGIK